MSPAPTQTEEDTTAFASPALPVPPLVDGGWSGSLAGTALVRCTVRADGDFAAGEPVALAERRSRIVPRPWTALRQEHGARVVHVVRPGDGVDVYADAAVCTTRDVALAVVTADCAPIALASPEGVIGIVHAGWRGLLAGVVGATVDAMGALGATRVHALVGPCVHAECYAFSPADLDDAVRRGGSGLRGVDRTGGPALDLPAGVRSALESAGAVVDEVSTCTACSPLLWSWRARRDRCRQATVIWRR